MKKFNGRKLLALMMTLIMLLSLMPAAFADGEAEAAPAVQDGETPAEPTPAPVEPTPEPKYLAKIGDVKYETLDDAVKAAQSGDVIELLDDCTSGGMDLTKSITIKGNYSITFAGKGIALRGAALTFDGCTVVMTGIGATGNAELGWMTIALGSGSSLNLSGASLTLDGSGVASNVHAVYCTGNNTINVAGSSLTIKNYPQDAIEWVGGSAEYSVNISGGSTVVLDRNRSGFTGTFKVHSVGSTLQVTNSSGNASNGTDFVFDGGVVDFSGNTNHAISSTSEMTFKGGVNAKINNNGLCAMYIKNGKISISADSTVEVSGNGKSEDVADVYAHRGDYESGHADQARGGDDADVQESEGYADGQRVYARRDRHEEHGLEAKIVVELLGLAEGLLYHVAADEGQQNESYPMVNVRDEMLEPEAEQIADDRHEKLKSAEINADQQRMLRAELFDAQALAYGHGKGVHAKADGDEEQSNKTHYGMTSIIVISFIIISRVYKKVNKNGL